MATLIKSSISQSGYEVVNLDQILYTFTGKDASSRWITFKFSATDTVRWDYTNAQESAYFTDLKKIENLAE